MPGVGHLPHDMKDQDHIRAGHCPQTIKRSDEIAAVATQMSGLMPLSHHPVDFRSAEDAFQAMPGLAESKQTGRPSVHFFNSRICGVD